jgi:hypothetical protein
MKRIHRLAAAGLLACAAAAGHAQAMKPGLWEHHVVTKSDSGTVERMAAEMRRQLESLPPEQRRQMETMMAAQGMGIDASGQTIKVCLTAEQAKKLDIAMPDGSCTQQVLQRSASSMKVAFQCKGDTPMRGESEVRFQGDTGYTAQSVVHTTVDGKPERLQMTQTGKWLGAQCGNVQPVR